MVPGKPRGRGVNILPQINLGVPTISQYIYNNSWIFIYEAVAVAVVVVVVVAVVVDFATASAANKTRIFKRLKFLRIIVIIIFHIFTENSKSGCDLQIAYRAVATRSQFDLKIAIKLVAVPLATATATHLKIQLRHCCFIIHCPLPVSLGAPTFILFGASSHWI